MDEKSKKELYQLIKKLVRKRAARLASASKTKNETEKRAFNKRSVEKIQKPVIKSGFIFLFYGIVSITFSLIFNSTLLVFLGLTLTFWGFLFLFVLPSKYVKSEVLDSMALSSLSALNKVIADSNCRGKAVYVPPYPKNVYAPQHLRELKDGLVFFSAKNDEVESVIEQAFMKNPEGLRLVPPGLSLAKLIEKELGLDLSNTNLDFLMDTLPNVLVDDLELAKDFKINSDKDLVHMEVSELACEGLCKEVSKLTNICHNLGCPLCSSIACVLTKVTNKPVVIERCRLRNNVIDTWYHILKG